MPKQTFNAIVYKADNAFYQAGKYIAISCHHTPLGNFGMNTYGEVVPLPGAATASPPVAMAVVPEGTVFPTANAFGDANFKAVTQVKDLDALATYYVDTASYNANVVTCNATVVN